MLVSEMIYKLQKLQDQLGDVEVLITDGYNVLCYQGEYDIGVYEDFDSKKFIDIGIGGCENFG